MVNVRQWAKLLISLFLGVVMACEGMPEVVYGACDINAQSDSAETESEIIFSEVELIRKGDLNSVYYPVEKTQAASETVEELFKSRIIEGVNNYELTVDISDLGMYYSNDEDIDMMYNAMYEVLNIDWRCFYLSGRFGYTYDEDDMLMTTITVVCDSEYQNEDKSLNLEYIQEKKNLLKSRVDYALSYVNEDMTDLEKALTLHDFLVTTCDYDYENYDNGFLQYDVYTVWGVLVDERAVCQGYAQAYSALLKEVGIDSIVVSSSDMEHAWNMVYIDEYWYHVDVTWDDPVFTAGYTDNLDPNNDCADIGYVSHEYFMKSDEEFLQLRHYGWQEYETATKSGAFDDYFFTDSKQYNFMPYNSDWYFMLPGGAPSIYKFDIYTSGIYTNGMTQINVMGTAISAGLIGDTIYYGGAEGIYSYNITDGTNEMVVDISEKYPGFYLTEFTTRYGTSRVVLYSETLDMFMTDTISTEHIEVTGVVLDREKINLKYMGETYQLGEMVLPMNASNQKVVWTSSDTEVVTVDENGLVTAVGTGNATITVTTQEGDFKDSCQVEVQIYATGMTLNASELYFGPDDLTPFQLTATLTPSNAQDTIIWISGDESTATVDETGLVTPVGSGVVNITAISSLSGMVCMCRVTVKMYADVSGVQLSDTSISLTNDPYTLTATVLPENASNKNVSWSTSDYTIATVDPYGTVEPVSDGTCTITATTWEGGYTATCQVTVTRYWAVEGVFIEPSAIELTEIGATYQLTETVYPENATNKEVEWTSLNPDIATVDNNGLVRAINKGEATIQVKTECGGYTDTCDVYVNIEDDTPENPDEYEGNINSELLKFTYDEDTKYISGEIVVVEWVDGVSTVPSVKPVMTFESTDGTESIDVFVTATGTNTYYFDRMLAEGLSDDKEYVFVVTSGDENNVSEYRSVPIYTGTSSIGSEGTLGSVGQQNVCFKTQEGTGYLLVYGQPDTYEGQVNSVLTEVSCVTSELGNFVSGKVVIVEWIDGVSHVPTTTPKMTFESSDGSEQLDVFMASIDGSNTYYFDRNLTEEMDVNKEYIFRITLTDDRNVSPYKSMIATTNYMDAKEGILWETDTQIIKYKTVWNTEIVDNQLTIYAENK